MLQHEYTNGYFHDARLTARFQRIAFRLAKAPHESLPQVMKTEAELEATYRFLQNEKVTLTRLLAPHQRATRERARQAGRVLVLHDTTDLVFGGTTRTGLETSLNSGTQSVFAHLSLCVARNNGDPLGLLRLQTFLNPPLKENEPKGKKAQDKRRRARPKSERLSQRWPEGVLATQASLPADVAVTHVMDREADDYDSFACMHQHRIRFLVRLNYDRVLAGPLPYQRISQVVLEVPAVASREITLSPRKKAVYPTAKHEPRPKRQARIEIGAHQVELVRPKDANQELPPTLMLNAVIVREIDPPIGMVPVEWKLITNEPIETAEQILELVDIYRKRWLIEDYIKALKSGCRVQERELESQKSLVGLVAMMAPIAWHMMRLRAWAREEPTRPATELFTPVQLAVLEAVAERTPLPPEPTVRDAMWSMAGLGGHLKRNGPPGFLVMARGYYEFLKIEQGYLKALERRPPGGPPLSPASEDVSNH